MKRIVCLITGILLCFTFFACSNATEDIQVPVAYYYQTADFDYQNPTGIIVSETHESFGHENDYFYLTEQYLNGPSTADCISPFPTGTHLEQLTILDDRIMVILSTDFATLSGHDLTIACSCFAKTLIEMTGLDTVTISAKDALLDGTPSITMTKNDFLLTDSNEYIPNDSR